MMKVPSYDIAIVGEGVTGLSTAYHLREKGANVITIAHPRKPSTTPYTAGLLAGGMADNFSRFTHAHGIDFAKDLWAFSNDAFDAVIRFAGNHAVPFEKKRRVRLIVSEAELKEAEIAVSQLNKVNLPGKLLEPSACSDLSGLSARVLAVQDDGERGAWIDSQAFVHALRKDSLPHVECPLHAFARDPNGHLELDFTDGSAIRAHMLVLACHDHIGHFLPQLRDALVSFGDQWSEIETPNSPESAGIVFSANHGHEWGVLLPQKVHFGGGRYLRKLAGIGENEAREHPEIAKHLQKQLAKTFDWAHESEIQSTTALIDIWPCDELPIIGPMFGESRVLLATGYMYSGLSLGFQAGRCLSELILQGASERLPRRLYPERLRSL